MADTDYVTLMLAMTPAPKVLCPGDDASGNARDATGGGHTGTVSGSVTYQQTGPVINSEAQYAISHATTGPEFQVANTYDNDVTDQMGAAIWVKTASTSLGILGGYNAAGSDKSWYIYQGSGGSPSLFTYQTDGSTAYGSAGSTIDISDDAWHCIQVWIDSNGYPSISVDQETPVQNTSPNGTWNGPNAERMDWPSDGDGDGITGLWSLMMYWDSDPGTDNRQQVYDGIPGGTTVTPPAAVTTATAQVVSAAIEPEAATAAATATAQVATGFASVELAPIADDAVAGWTVAPLYSKVDEDVADGTVITDTTS